MEGKKVAPSAKKEKKHGKRRHSGIMRRWITNNLSIIAMILIFIVCLVSFGLKEYFYSSIRDNLTNRVESTSGFINHYLSSSYEEFYVNAERLTNDFVDKDKVEMQIIDVYGRIMFSSYGLTAGLLPETSDVVECLSNMRLSVFEGYNQLTDERVASVTSPLFDNDGQLIGAVRFVSSLEKVDSQIVRIVLLLILAVAVIFGLIIISNSYFIGSIVNPVLKINDLAKKIAEGQYGIVLEKSYDDEIGELCDTINYMSAEINRAEKVKNDFISSVSHELKTPLTAINGWSETLLSEHFVVSEEGLKGLDIIRKETKRLSTMVDELLEFARLESGKMKLQIEAFDLRGELSDAMFIYSDMLQKEGFVVRYDEPDEPVMILGDRDRLRQVFLNIIDNAAKYGKDENRDDNRIDMIVRSDGVYGIVEIKDYGQGILPDELPFVKEKFFKGSSKQRGTGIGLAVCDEIIRLHGGQLDIKSQVGEGTSVLISLPLMQENKE